MVFRFVWYSKSEQCSNFIKIMTKKLRAFLLISIPLLSLIAVIVTGWMGYRWGYNWGYAQGYARDKIQDEFKPVDVIGGIASNLYIKIPEGETSYCFWRHKDDNSGLFKINLTTAEKGQEHKITIGGSTGGSFWRFRVYCFDDQGNNYKGKLRFPEANSSNK